MVTHVTIRESIFFLLLRLVITEVITLALFIMLQYFFVETTIGQASPQFNLPIFIIIFTLKMFIVFWVLLEWVNNYYEITPKEIIHKRGFLFKSEERDTLDHLGTLAIKQGMLGRIFNYGTIELHNWMHSRTVMLYLIHNPMKYHHVLQSLLPKADEQKEVFREHILYEDEV